jgi:hypothetical protein
MVRTLMCLLRVAIDVHCAKCGRWFCDAHAEDEEWHPCMLPLGDEGGEE